MDGERSLPAGMAQRVRPVKQLARSMYSQYGCTLFPCIYTAAAHRKASPAFVSLLRALFTRSEVVVQRIAILEERFDRVRTPCAARERDCLTLAAHAHREVSTLMAPNGAHAHDRVRRHALSVAGPREPQREATRALAKDVAQLETELAAAKEEFSEAESSNALLKQSLDEEKTAAERAKGPLRA